MRPNAYQELSHVGNKVVCKLLKDVHRYTNDKAVNYSRRVLAFIKSGGISQRNAGPTRRRAAVSSARITASTECRDSSIRIYRRRLLRVPRAKVPLGDHLWSAFDIRRKQDGR